MADIWMDVDTALSEVPVNIMPLIDDTDFKTREEAITYNQAGMDLVWNFVTTAGAMSQTAVTPTTGGDYDWANQGNGMYSIEIPASGGASINNDTEGYGWFTGYCTGVLPWRGPVIGFRAAALNNALIDGGDLLDVNVTHVADTAQTANDNGADINAILADTNELQTDWTDGGRLDLIADAILADTNELQTDDTPGALAAIDAKIDIIDANVDLVLEDTGTTLPGTLTTIASYLDTEIAAILEDTGTTIPAQISGLNDPTAAAIADAVLDEALAGHVAAGSLGKAVADIEADTNELQTDDTPGALAAIDAKIDTIDGIVDNIVADTNELQTDWTDGGRLDLIADAILADTNELQTDDTPGALAAIDAKIDTIDGNVDLVLEDTGTTLPGTLTTIASYLDTEIAAILEDTGTTIPAQISGLNDPTAAAIADAVWDETLGDHLGAGSTGNALNAAGAAGDPWSTALPGAYGAGTAGKIVGDNINAPLNTIDTVVDSIKAKTDNLPADPADESSLEAAITAAHATTDGKIDTIDANVDLVLEDTGTTLPGTLTTIAGYIDTEVAAIKAVTDVLNTLIEADGGDYRFTENALEQAPGGAGVAADEIVTALLAKTGCTAGGTWTFAKVMKVVNAFSAMMMQLKSGSTTVYEILDPDDETTVIAELTTSGDGSTPPSISIKI